MPLWIELTTPKLAAMTRKDLSDSVCTLGGWGYHPGDASSWFRAFFEATRDISAFPPIALSNIFNSLAQLKEVPDAVWLDPFWSASKEKLAELKPQELSNFIRAAATLGCSPPADWLAQFFDLSKKMLSVFIPQSLSNTIWALAAESRH